MPKAWTPVNRTRVYTRRNTRTRTCMHRCSNVPDKMTGLAVYPPISMLFIVTFMRDWPHSGGYTK